MEFYFYKAKYYKTIVEVTCSKYDNIQDLTETFVYKYKCKEITDGYKTSLYRSENGNSFYVEESSSSKYSNFYYLAIFDTAINKQVNDEEKEKTRNYILEDL